MVTAQGPAAEGKDGAAEGNRPGREAEAEIHGESEESTPPRRTEMARKRKPDRCRGDPSSPILRGQAQRLAELEEARANDEVTRQIFQLRSDAGLTQRDLAKLVGTTASLICRLEDADYEGHTLAMLRRIASVLQRRVVIRFVPAKFIARYA
jgi:ribosome-binding protein aMBF1 (putative translation factor)